MGDLILGTAQLGQRYGIANRTGRPDAATAHAIIAAAWAHGIHAFDIAPSYGDAEVLLGSALAALGVTGVARVMTKLEKDINAHDYDAIIAAIEHARARIGTSRIHGLLVRGALLNDWEVLRPALRMLTASGVVERIGVTVYTPDEAIRALALDDVRFVQVPTNVLDRRFLAAGVFQRAAEQGKRMIVRSVFLQGLLTMAVEDAPALPGAREALRGIQRAAAALGMIPLPLALAYVRERCPHADILVGAETPEQVAELAALWAQRAQPCAGIIEQYVPVGTIDLINPTRWRAAIHR